MTDADRREFAVTIESLAAAFNRTAGEALINGYWIGLFDLPLDAVIGACARAMVECEWMPVPSVLRRMLGHLSPQMRAVKAWSVVVKSIADHGGYQSVDFDDPLTNAAVRTIGGWRHLCRQTDHELGFTAKNFERAYQMHFDAPPNAEQCKHLPGTFELENYADGQPVKAPVRVAVGLPAGPKQRAALPARTSKLVKLKQLNPQTEG